MNNKLYHAIKNQLAEYDFDQSSTFSELFSYVRAYVGSNSLSLKKFIKVAQNMGVTSQVGRNSDGKVKRSLTYDASNDKYLSGEMTNFVPCDKCSGTGLVAATVVIEPEQT